MFNVGVTILINPSQAINKSGTHSETQRKGTFGIFRLRFDNRNDVNEKMYIVHGKVFAIFPTGFPKTKHIEYFSCQQYSSE